MKLKFQYQLILYYLMVITVVLLAAMIYTLQRNKDFNLITLQKELVASSENIYKIYKSGVDFCKAELPAQIRLTIIDTTGWVLFDNHEAATIADENYLRRPEISKAAETGEGTVLRYSDNMKNEYLYYAKRYPEFYVRTSTLYKNENIYPIDENNNYQYLIISLLILLVASLVYISKKLTKPLKALTEFTDILRSDHKDFSSVKFPHNEYGEIGKKIVDTFNQLEKTKLYKQQMSHNIAHELKTPVTGIRAYLETILHDENMDMEQVRRFADKAYAQTVRLSSLINDVSTLNKIEEGAEQFQVEEVKIANCLKEVQEELGYKLKAGNITINILISSTLSINGCYSLIYSLFKNLIDNTIEHGGPGSVITINAGITQKSGDKGYRLNFTYSDTGKGVPDEELERLFERFYRVEKGRTRKTGGSGLGLAIVKNAVLFHKGNITAENRPGGGLLFKFNLMSL